MGIQGVKIPKSFQLFGSTVNVITANDIMNELENYGDSHYSTLTIRLATSNGVKQLPVDRVEDTFYHELVHMILDSMKEGELSSNEKFVDTFGKLLRQAINTFKYE
jgi:hypothetical protein